MREIERGRRSTLTAMDMESLAGKDGGDRGRRRWSVYSGEGSEVLALAGGERQLMVQLSSQASK